MKVILMRDVARIGRRYDVKEVPSGHALNFLIPRKLAVPATPLNLKRVQSEKGKHEASDLMEAQNFGEALEKLKDMKVSLTAEANDKGHLFRGVKADDIHEALAAHGLRVDASHIELEHPLKSVGMHEIQLHAGDKRGTFVLEIVAK